MCGLVGFLGGVAGADGDEALRQGSGQALLRRMSDTLRGTKETTCHCEEAKPTWQSIWCPVRTAFSGLPRCARNDGVFGYSALVLIDVKGDF